MLLNSKAENLTEEMIQEAIDERIAYCHEQAAEAREKHYDLVAKEIWKTVRRVEKTSGIEAVDQAALTSVGYMRDLGYIENSELAAEVLLRSTKFAKS